MRNVYLREKTAADIDKQVAKILRDLGNPAPPVRMEEVLDRLRLDKRYYSTTKDGYLRDTVHQLKVAGRQVIERPSLLLDAVRKLSLKALYLPDRKRILIDETLPSTKQRWSEAHEVSHSVIPWHERLMHGDVKQTLSPGCHVQVEAEANYGAGRLLFLQDEFAGRLDPGRLTMSEVKALAKVYGNSITSTLWRAVEQLGVPAVGLISGHPNRPAADFDPSQPCEYLIRSRRFETEFAQLDESMLYAQVAGYCCYATRGPLGEDELSLTDTAGSRHIFRFETFHNNYQALTLGVYKCPRPQTAAIAARPTASGRSPVPLLEVLYGG